MINKKIMDMMMIVKMTKEITREKDGKDIIKISIEKIIIAP